MPTADDESRERGEPDNAAQLLAIEERPIAELLPFLPRRRPYGLNAIVGTAAQISAGGFPHPVILSRHGPLLDGPLLIDAARWLDLETVPCLSLPSLGAFEGRCLLEAVATLNAKGAWTHADLEAEWRVCVAADSQIGIAGFTPIDLDQLMPELEIEPDCCDGDE